MRNAGGGYDAARNQTIDRKDDTGDPGGDEEPTATRLAEDAELRRLLPAAADGNGAARDAFLRVLQPHVVRYCRARLGGHPSSSAEEVSQDVLMAVCDSLHRFEPSGPAVLAFVIGIAKHKVADSFRAQKRNHSVPSESVPDSVDLDPGPEYAAIQSMEAARVRAAMTKLPDNYREVLILRIAMGYSGAEVAAHLATSAGAVRVTQHRAMTKLREILAAEEAA